ncbi:hypothetical protein SAMN05216524_11317 [Mucilaginibacter sp. OK098]|nr:hypothetical protein SAMN05216524_11317 [Mucilaginibacter sp. OK098]
MKHAYYKPITGNRQKSKKLIVIDYQILTYRNLLKLLIIRMFHLVPRVRVEKWNALPAIYGSKKADLRVETRDAIDR